VIAEIFPRDKRSISRREAELEWRRLRELSAITVMKEDITNAIQNHSAIVLRTDIGCFEKMIFIANLVTDCDNTYHETIGRRRREVFLYAINHIFLVVIR
jgi:hypothetical protein